MITPTLFLTACLMPGLPDVVLAQNAELHERLHAVAQSSSIDLPDAHPWHLKLAVQVPSPASTAVAPGTVEEWWSSPTQYRIEYDLPAYKGTLLRNGDGYLRTAGLGPAPFIANFLLAQTVHPLPADDWTAASQLELEHTQTGAMKLDCLTIKQPSAPTICMDAGSPVLRATFPFSGQTLGRDRLGSFRGHSVPVELTLKAKGALEAEAHVMALQGQETSYADKLSSDGLEAVQMPVQDRTVGLVPGHKLQGADPLYPRMARAQEFSGTLVLDVVIGPDGHVLSSQGVFAVDPFLLHAAADAVRQWIYEPARLNGKPVPIETLTTVSFSRVQ